ncbi:MAG: hypothetical protein KDB71_20955 [Mycobacterium sp.]|nr:hypothetical protein [Mycobacterium sp.]
MQTILDRIDPLVSAAAAAVTADTLRSPGACQQVWCPVCALAALANGEQHPLLTVLAEHSVTVMALLRTLVADPAAAAAQTGPETASTDEPGSPDEPGSAANNGSRYQPIPIVIETDNDEG